MTDRTVERTARLCIEAKLRAFDLLNGGPEAAVLALAANMLAEYAACLEDALGGSVPAPWEQPAARSANDDPHQWLDERDREYERRCKRDGVEP